ncbi:MAG: hypothetical protein ACRD8O_16495 [Bryobacteraceae bacterium]
MWARTFLLIALAARVAAPQAIEFESNGLKYQTLTRNGVTLMYAHLPVHVREFMILQVAVSNGGRAPAMVKPEDFRFERSDGTVVRAAAARYVVDSLLERGNRGDVIKLVSTYESALYGMQRIRSTNGYEQRRRDALAEVSSTRLKAAAAASAIALVQTRLIAGQSTDGAVFFPTDGKPLGSGRLVVRAAGTEFGFNAE